MARLYVANVASGTNMEEVREMFGECGKLKSFNLQNGCGYIEYELIEQAEDAIKKMNGKEICGESIVVEPSRKIIPRIRDKGVYQHQRVNNQRRPRYYHTRDRERERERSSTPRYNKRRNKREESHSRSHSRSRSRSDSRRNKHHHHKKH